jgi:hypothetical protein
MLTSDALKEVEENHKTSTKERESQLKQRRESYRWRTELN